MQVLTVLPGTATLMGGRGDEEGRRQAREKRQKGKEDGDMDRIVLVLLANVKKQ